MVGPWDKTSGFREKSWQHKKDKHNSRSKSRVEERKEQKTLQNENRKRDIVLQKMPGYSYEEAIEALKAFFTNPDVQQLDGKKDIEERIPAWIERDIVQEESIRKSRGPGGQNVNKKATTIRIALPSLTLVHEAQSERKPEANRRKARAWLADKVYELSQLWQSCAR